MKVNLFYLSWDECHDFHLQTAIYSVSEAKSQSTASISWECHWFCTLVCIFSKQWHPHQEISACCRIAVLHPGVPSATDALALLVPACCMAVSITGSVLETSKWFIGQQTKSFKGDWSLGAVALSGRSGIELSQKCIALGRRQRTEHECRAPECLGANVLLIHILLSWGSSAVL